MENFTHENIEIIPQMEHCRSPLDGATKKVEEPKKEVVYQNTNVKIGTGKLGPIQLIIYQNQLFALKVVPKKNIDKPKRIQHLKNEKFILNMLKSMHTNNKSGAGYTQDRYFEDHTYLETKDTSLRHSYLIDDTDTIAKPLSYIVNLEQTFSDPENVNFIFEYLPGQDLYWLLQNQMILKLGKDDKKKWVHFYTSQVICALEVLQRYNIVYRDLKPENVMIDKEGLVKLIDFGFAKIL